MVPGAGIEPAQTVRSGGFYVRCVYLFRHPGKTPCILTLLARQENNGGAAFLTAAAAKHAHDSRHGREKASSNGVFSAAHYITKDDTASKNVANLRREI